MLTSRFGVRRQFLSLLVVAASILSWACRRTSENDVNLRIEHEITPQPIRVGVETVSLKLTDGFGKPVTGARVTLEGNMSHAGMSPVFAKTTEVTPGNYRGSIEFSMGGDWIITVRAGLTDGKELERQFEVKGVRSD